jgi:sulfur carrier protein ThiS
MEVRLVPEGGSLRVDFKADRVRVRDVIRVLRRRGVVQGEVVVILGGRPLPEDAIINADATVTVVRVLSGGSA